MPDAERRQHERFELLVQVTLHRSEQVETLTVINISAGGVLLRNDHDVAFSIGELIRVDFDVTELAPSFAIEAQVIRVLMPAGRPAALAAMWTSSDAVANAALAEILWSLSNRR